MDMSGNDKETKNILRRVYDALNVLISVGVIVKLNKRYLWQGIPTLQDQNSLTDRNDMLMNKRYDNQRKKEALLNLTTKFYALRELMRRNQTVPKTQKVIRFPFVVVGTEEHPSNRVRVEFNRTKTYVSVKVSKDISLFDDEEILGHLRLTEKTQDIPPELTHLLGWNK